MTIIARTGSWTDTHTDRQTDTCDENTRSPKLCSEWRHKHTEHKHTDRRRRWKYSKSKIVSGMEQFDIKKGKRRTRILSPKKGGTGWVSRVSEAGSKKQGKSEGFDSCDRPSNLKLDSNRQFFRPCDREIWLMTLQNNRAPLLCYFKLCTSFRSHWWIQTWVTVRKHTPNLGQIWQFLEPCDLEIWQMTLQNNRAPLLCYFKLCASFCSHWWIQTSITVRKRPIWVKFDDF